MVLLALLAGVFKTRAATLWGEAVDFGVSELISPMMFAAVGMLIFIALDGARTALHYTVIGQVTERMFRDIRMSIFRALSLADSAVVEKHMRSGDIALRACEDTEQLCETLAGRFGHYIRLVFQAIFAIVACVMLSWRLSIAYFLLLPISLWLLAVVSKPLQRLQKEARGGSGRSADIASSALSGVSAVKIFGLEKEMDRRFAIHVDETYDRAAKAGRIGMGMTTIKYVVSVLQTLVLFIVGAWLVSMELISIGAVMAFVALAVYVTEAFGLVDAMIFQVKSAFALSSRIYEVLDLPQQLETTLLPEVDYVNFEKLNFAYDDGENVLNDLTMRVQKGQKVALVGASGSGKSTVIKIICNMYGSELALVSQEAHLFEGSILDNVRYGRMSATDDEVISALKAADLWDYVSSLPDGMNTRLGEFGSKLSGGQRQRLSIARALIKDAKLVLLDEPTSALDSESEREIQTALNVLLEGRSALIVAHRLSTVQQADYIYCLENGTVVEEGTPADLYAKGEAGKGGYYYEMCKMQGVGV